MKKFLAYLIALVLIAGTLFLPGKADARRWKLYDNFNNGYIDSEKWEEVPNAAYIYLDTGNGRVCFEQMEPYQAGVSSWLKIKKSGKRIRGIRADITVEEGCIGDVRGRLGGTIGEVGDYTVFGQLSLQGGLERAYGDLGLEEPGNPAFWEDLVWARFPQPLDISGNTFTAEWRFSRHSTVYHLQGYGMIYFLYPQKIRIGGDSFGLGIGTRSSNGEGPCTVCFDNVYIRK